MAPPTNFAVRAAPGGYLATWDNDLSLNAANVVSMSLVYTTTEANAQFQSIALEPTVVGGDVISEYLLTNLPTGFTYQMSLQIASTDENLSGASEPVPFSAVSAPTKPVFKVTATDNQLLFTLLNASLVPITLADRKTPFDGFEDLTKVEIAFSDKTTGSARNLSILADASGNFYRDGGFTLSGSLFNNVQKDHTYAVALTYFNENGKSVISDTKFFTPSELPIDMETAAVESINVDRLATGGATIFWNPPSNNLSGIQSVSKINSYSVWRAVVTDASAGTAQIVLQDAMLDISGNNSQIQAAALDASGIVILNRFVPSLFDGVSYKFKWADTTAQNGTKYRYYLTAKTDSGASTTKDSSSYSDVLVGGKPLAPVVESTPGDRQLKLFVNTAGKLNGLQSSGKVYVKLYSATQALLSDASQNALHGYNWSQLTLDASSCVTLVGLNNGTHYRAGVKIETQSNVLPASKYVSEAGHLSRNTSPYKVPAVPTGLSISPLDVSGNPLDRKLNLSWNAQSYLAANGFGPDASVNFVIIRHEGLDASGNRKFETPRYPGTLNRFLDTGLVNDKVYYYALEAKVNNVERGEDIFSPESTPEVAAFPFASPAAVSNVVLDCSGNADLFATWSAIADGSANYKLVLSKNNVVLDTLYPVTSGVVLSNSVYNFALGADYSVEVRSVISRNGNLYCSSPMSATGIPFLTPGAVQDLQLSISSGQIFAVWEKPLNMDVSGVITGVKIDNYDVVLQNAFGFDISANFSSTSDLYKLITGLNNNTTYRVKIVARGRAGSNGTGKVVYGLGANSGDARVNQGPNPAVLLTSQGSDRTIKLIWVHADAEVTSFKVYQDNALLNNPTPEIKNEGLHNDGNIIGNKWSTTITGLTNGTSYYFEVIASKSGIDSTAAYRTDTPYKSPSAPTAVSQPFSVASNSLTLNWGVPVDNGGAGSGGAGPLKYKVQIYDTSNNTLSDASAATFVVQNQNNILQLTFTESSQVLNGKSYYANVYSYYNINSTDQTSAALRIPASGSIKVNDAPQNVTDLAVAAKDKSVVLTWVDPSSNVNYPYTTTIVQRSEDNTNFVQIGAVSRVGSFTDSNLINGKPYYYKVIAQHSNSSAQQPSGVDVNTTPAGAPIFAVNNQWNNVDVSGNLDFKLRFNKNGASVRSATLVGIDFNGVAIVRSFNVFNIRSLEAATFNGQPCLASETIEWTIPRIDNNNNNNKIKDLLFVLTNDAGSTVVSWPIPPNAFDK